MRLTEAELIEALRNAMQHRPAADDGCLTTSEIADALAIPRSTALQLVHRMVKSGAVDAMRVRRVGIDGVIRPTTAYRVRP